MKSSPSRSLVSDSFRKLKILNQGHEVRVTLQGLSRFVKSSCEHGVPAEILTGYWVCVYVEVGSGQKCFCPGFANVARSRSMHRIAILDLDFVSTFYHVNHEVASQRGYWRHELDKVECCHSSFERKSGRKIEGNDQGPGGVSNDAL